MLHLFLNSWTYFVLTGTLKQRDCVPLLPVAIHLTPSAVHRLLYEDTN
jgi:hypothetical protein